MSDTILQDLYQVVLGRKSDPQEGSYTCYLFDKGLDKILKKVGEECSETIIAAKNGKGGRDFRPHLPPDGDDGRPEHPSGRGAGRIGASEP